MTRTADIDLLLTSWLAEGTDRAPEDRVRAAMLEIEHVGQQRAPITWRLRGANGPTVGRLLAVAAVVAVVMLVGIGVGIQTGLIRLPDPVPAPPSPTDPASITPAPSDGSSLLTYQFDDEAFALSLAAEWAIVQAPRSGIAAEAQSASGLHVSVITSTDGAFEVCSNFADIGEECWRSLAASVDGLIEAALTDPFDTDVAFEVVDDEARVLDGEDARLVTVERTGGLAEDGTQFAFLAAIHDGRGFLLRFASDSLQIDADGIEHVLTGFSFLTTEPVLYTSVEDGYEVLLPPFWASSAARVPGEDTDHPQDETTFGVGGGAGTRDAPGLTIRIGSPDGWIRTCRPSCEPIHVTSLDELEDAIRSTSELLCSDDCPTEEPRGDITLGGAPARFETTKRSGSCLGCPHAYHHVFGIIDGRPVILSFDDWNIRFDRFSWYAPPSEWVRQIVESFRLLEPAEIEQPEAIDGFRTFTAPDGTFAIRMPEPWIATSGTDPSAVYLQSGRFSLSARGADANRVIRTCDRGAGPWESCTSVSASDLDELAGSIGLRSDRGIVFQGPIASATTLGGEPATRHWIVASDNGRPTAVQYVTAMHDGRPFIVRVAGPAPADGAVGFAGIPDGVEFLASAAPGPIEQPDAVDGFRTFTATDGTFEIRLPEVWNADYGGDPLTLYLRNGRHTLSISGADANGELPACDDRILMKWGPCGRVTGSSIGALERAIGLGTRGIVYTQPAGSSASSTASAGGRSSLSAARAARAWPTSW